MGVIYETKGRAREFSELAVNLYTGCGHQCIYCYGADILRVRKDNFDNCPMPKPNILQRLETEAAKLSEQGEKRSILMCFITDPLQPIEAKHEITRRALDILHQHGLNATILTKAGRLALQYMNYGFISKGDTFATTLTCDNSFDSARWEPGAASPADRINNLSHACAHKIRTWVSLEPVIYPFQALNLINATRDMVDHYKVGTMNYHEHGKTINWKEFAMTVTGFMDGMKVNYYIKKDLAEYLGKAEGYWKLNK